MTCRGKAFEVLFLKQVDFHYNRESLKQNFKSLNSGLIF